MPFEMGSMKYDIEKFNGRNDFGLWRIKMRAILIQQGLIDALNKNHGSSGSKTEDGAEKEKIRTEIMDKAQSANILCLGDKPLREASKEQTATGMWLKLEKLYMTKYSAN